MVIIGIIMLEAAAFVALICCFAFWEKDILHWEDRQIRRLKKAMRKRLRKLCDRIEEAELRFGRIGRKIRRELCSRLLAKDRLTVAPVSTFDVEPICDESADAAYNDVMRLLGE